MRIIYIKLEKLIIFLVALFMNVEVIRTKTLRQQKTSLLLTKMIREMEVYVYYK